MIDKSVVGKKYKVSSFEIEKGKIREMARAIGDNNPVFYDEEAAGQAGYSGLALPPTFATVFALAGGLMTVVKDLKIDMAKLLHGGQEYQYFAEIKPGDTVSGETEITGVIEKSGKGGIMDLVIMETTYYNQNSKKVLCDKCTLVVTR